MDLRQTLKLTQQLVMTPQLQQAIKLLQMSRLEMIETINEEMEINPALEETMEQEESAEPRDKDAELKEKVMDDITEDVSSMNASEKEIDWEQYLESYSSTEYTSTSYEREEAPSYENILKSRDTLADHLRWQMRVSHLNDRERSIADFIIGNIADDGYLKATVEEIVESTGAGVEEIESVLAVVQEFDPVGVAARDLNECLLKQAKYLGLEDSLVGDIIRYHLPDIEKRKLSLIAKEQKVSMDEVVAAVKVISEMEPRPGRDFSDETVQYITPDLYVYKMDGEYVIVQNDEGLPRLRISNYYRSILEKGVKKGDAKEYVQEKIRSALWLIKSIHQRQRTIYKVMESILKFQRDFFDRGVEHLKPLVLKDVAEDIGMHESTISRVTNNKYVHTSHGIFELKFFFNSGIGRQGEGDIASESVKEKIRHIVSGENPRKPLSDQAIVDLLKEAGINIARRTVTKYREMMGIASSSKRKKLF